MARPRPRPPWARVVPPSACRKRSNTWGRKSVADADPRVRDAHAHEPVSRFEPHLDAAALRGELHRVRRQVRDHLLQPLRVAEHAAAAPRAALNGDLDALLRGGGACRVEARLHHRLHLHGPQLDAQLPAHDARHVQQVLDELGLQPHVAVDHVQAARHAGGVEPARAQHGRPAHDRRERRPQLVGQGGQELVLERVLALRHAARLLLARQEQALLLGGLAPGDVAGEDVDEALLAERGRGPGEPAVGAVAVQVAVLEAGRGCALERGPETRRPWRRGRPGEGGSRWARAAARPRRSPGWTPSCGLSWRSRPSSDATPSMSTASVKNRLRRVSHVEPVRWPRPGAPRAPAPAPPAAAAACRRTCSLFRKSSTNTDTFDFSTSGRTGMWM